MWIFDQYVTMRNLHIFLCILKNVNCSNIDVYCFNKYFICHLFNTTSAVFMWNFHVGNSFLLELFKYIRLSKVFLALGVHKQTLCTMWRMALGSTFMIAILLCQNIFKSLALPSKFLFISLSIFPNKK